MIATALRHPSAFSHVYFPAACQLVVVPSFGWDSVASANAASVTLCTLLYEIFAFEENGYMTFFHREIGPFTV